VPIIIGINKEESYIIEENLTKRFLNFVFVMLDSSKIIFLNDEANIVSLSEQNKFLKKLETEI